MSISVHAVSPANEMPVARALERLIATAWPDILQSTRDRIDVLVGVRTPTDVDLLIVLDLERPRRLPSQRRRGGLPSRPTEIGSAIIAVEVKQLDAGCMQRVGNQLFACYEGKRERRSVNQQARDAATAVGHFAAQSVEKPFVHAIAWVTEMDDTSLHEIEPMVVGSGATWFSILDAAVQQHPIPAEADPRMESAMHALRQRLLSRRIDSARDRQRVEALSRDLAGRGVVDTLAELAGTAQIRLQGRGGSGKTTSLALLATRLAERGDRVLLLTFHRSLQADIAHLVDALVRPTGVPRENISVETTASFFLAALRALGVAMPARGDGSVDYDRFDAVLDETRQLLVVASAQQEGDVERLKREEPAGFEWDHVLIDESQDWSDAERDFLRALYGHRRLVLADGLEQLVRRQQSCNWNAGVPSAERQVHSLEQSLRMLRNVAIFANCVARAMNFSAWNIAPREELAGGRVFIVTGDVAVPDLARALTEAARADKADAVDCLICVPPSGVRTEPDGRKRALFAEAAQRGGMPTWDATDPYVRGTSPSGRDALRVVQYDSCRGLEGWITVAADLDEFYLKKQKYPNPHPADPPIDPNTVASRWLLIPLTRAVHTMIISVRDRESVVAGYLRLACDDPALPRGVVEWVTPEECIARLVPAAR